MKRLQFLIGLSMIFFCSGAVIGQGNNPKKTEEKSISKQLEQFRSQYPDNFSLPLDYPKTFIYPKTFKSPLEKGSSLQSKAIEVPKKDRNSMLVYKPRHESVQMPVMEIDPNTHYTLSKKFY